MPENSNTVFPSVPAGVGRDWEAYYQSGETPWDKGEAHPALVRWLQSHQVAGRILVPGCGSGHDVRLLASRPMTEVVGLDLAPSAALAASRFACAGGERYLTGNFLHANCPGELFDWIFEHTWVCAIDPALRPAYARSAATRLRPGGRLLAIFYCNPGHGGVDSPPYGCSLPEVGRLFGPWFDLVAEESNIETFTGREGREVLRCMRRNSAPCQIFAYSSQPGEDLNVPPTELRDGEL